MGQAQSKCRRHILCSQETWCNCSPVNVIFAMTSKILQTFCCPGSAGSQGTSLLTVAAAGVSLVWQLPRGAVPMGSPVWAFLTILNMALSWPRQGVNGWGAAILVRSWDWGRQLCHSPTLDGSPWEGNRGCEEKTQTYKSSPRWKIREKEIPVMIIILLPAKTSACSLLTPPIPPYFL